MDNTEYLEPVLRITRDIKAAARLLSPQEARFLVDAYYAMQRDRIRAGHQQRALGENDEPNSVMGWLFQQREAMERSVGRALDAYSGSLEIGTWARSITGIGPIIAAGLACHIDINQAPTAGHIWSFAGLNPSAGWEKGTKRPWNASLKTLCYKAGESFVKVQNMENDVYGKVFAERKALEISRNDSGAFVEVATAILSAKDFSKSTEAYQWYSGAYTPGATKEAISVPLAERSAILKARKAGKGKGQPMLPPAHVHARARRYAVKLFLAHYHHVLFEITFKKPPPMPYILAKDPIHTKFFGPPNWPMVEE